LQHHHAHGEHDADHYGEQEDERRRGGDGTHRRSPEFSPIDDLAAGAPDARETALRLRDRNVTATVVGARRLRMVTHLDVGPADADALIAAMGEIA